MIDSKKLQTYEKKVTEKYAGLTDAELYMLYSGLGRRYKALTKVKSADTKTVRPGAISIGTDLMEMITVMNIRGLGSKINFVIGGE